MSDLRNALEARRRQFQPEPGGFDRLAASRRRRRRNHRMVSAVVALAVAGAGVWAAVGAIGALRDGVEREVPAAPSLNPSNVRRLQTAWVGRIGSGPVSSPVVSDGTVFVATADTLYAFPASCAGGGGTCRPTWTAPTGGLGSVPASVTAADGVIFVASTRLSAFPTRCRSDGGACDPLWVSEPGAGSHRLSVPAVGEGRVFVGAADGSLYAFPMACGTRQALCEPLWVGAATPSHGFGNPVVENGMVYVLNSRLYAFPADCGIAGAQCEPAWTSFPPFSGVSKGPVVHREVVYVASDDLVYAFPVPCRTEGGACPTGWTWRPQTSEGRLLSPPAFADGLVYVNPGRIYVFPEGCAERGEDSCRALWLADKESLHPSSAPTASGPLVFVADARPYAYPTACGLGGETCAPLWVGPPAGPLDDAAAGYTSAAASEAGVFVATNRGRLLAFSVGGGRPR
jgi:outer membrane protein assembly factor BamB